MSFCPCTNRSGRSSPSLSETSNMTMTSGYSGENGDSGNAVVGQRLPLEASTHQQVVLRTPYGTFFREEMSGFYGMMADQPRRRCNTLDRDTLTRPRLHTIEEGNRRRYTLDRDYINKMVNRLSDRLEPRDSCIAPPAASISSSATSSPIQEEGSAAAMRGAAGSTSSGYSSCGSAGIGGGFTPISLPEGAQAGGGGGSLQLPVSRTSPMAAGAGVNVHSTPGSPNSRSRSGSFSQQADDYLHMRPRCYSFHHNSEGRAARMNLQRRLLAAAAAATPGSTSATGSAGQGSGQATGQPEDDPSSGAHPQAGKQGPMSSGDSPYLSAEMRRGSVGTAYGLHNRKSSLLVDRPLSYINRTGTATTTGGPEMDKRAMATANSVAAAHGLPLMKHVMPDGSIYPLGLPPPPEIAGHPHSSHHPHHPALWHPQAAAAAALAMGLAPPPHPATHSLPPSHPIMQQQQRNFPGGEDGITRSSSFSASSPSSSSYPSMGPEWEALAKQRSSHGSAEGEQQMREMNPPASTSKGGSPSAPSTRSPSSTISSVDAAAMKAAAAAAQGNMMMSMMMMGRPFVDAHSDPFIGHAFAAAAKERIGGRRSAGAESKEEADESLHTNGFCSPSSAPTSRVSPNLHPQTKPTASPSLSRVDADNEEKVLNTASTANSSSGSNTANLEAAPLSESSKEKSPSPDVSDATSGQTVATKFSSDRNSPLGEDSTSSESFGHKKFDKFRKVQNVADQPQASSTSAKSTATGFNGEFESMGKEEKMEEDVDEDRDEEAKDHENKKLKVDLGDVKVERNSPAVIEENDDAVMTSAYEEETSSHSPSPAHSPSGAAGEKPKLSAKEAHPNLLAHLMNGGSALKSAAGPALGQVKPASLGFPWPLAGQGMSPATLRHPLGPMQLQLQRDQQQMFKHPSCGGRSAQASVSPTSVQAQSVPSTSPSALSTGVLQPQQQVSQNSHGPFEKRTCSIFPSSQQQQDSNCGSENVMKEDFHAAAVYNLKDKILRKYDSMENLHKIAKGDSPSSSTSSSCSPSHPPLTSSQSSSALSSLAAASANSSPPPAAPITNRSNSAGNTDGLNKELATKLTICSTASAATSRSCSPHDATPASIARPNSLPSSSSTCPFSSSETASTTSQNAKSSASSNNVAAPGYPSNLLHPSALSQIPQMLLSHGIHPAMYHSMLARQFPSPSSSSSMSAAGGRMHPNHCASDLVAQNAPLASMQRFADLFARGQVSEPGEKTHDLGSPLNLTSRMDEGQRLSGSSSPSQSPQTAA
ncbi:nuclear hormone receptor e75 [Plakobranchus ocellatus]|uniref:Nuclear hormone receptor e75 n=1 Tax=Plakobranchus ocellatus TaxID=259542 RepID=A0AAV4CDY1_9GAST|nr:nuclear hormone receptor e75 [Plakobranchus ocellatus]